MPTIRQQMISCLERYDLTVRDLSQLLKITEKEVVIHLAHVQRSLKTRNQRLVVTPSRCCRCQFVFKKRTRLEKPGRCPQCKSGPIEAARYRVDPGGG